MYLIFPTHCMACPSGLMVGIKDEKKDILCVVAVVPPSQAKESKGLSVLGSWYRLDDITEERKLEEPTSLVLFLPHGEKHPRILSQNEEIIMILYDQHSASSLLSIHPLNMSNDSSMNPADGDSEGRALLPLPDKSTDSCIEEVIHYINMVQDPRIQNIIKPKKKSHVQEYLLKFLSWVLVLPSFLFGLAASGSRFLMFIMSHAVFRSKPMKYLLSLSVLGKQFSFRLKQITTANNHGTLPPLLNHMVQDNQDHRMSMKRYLCEKQRHFIVKGNLTAIIALDVILGAVIVIWLTTTNIIPDMANYLLQNTENVAQMLTQLIQWLMGVPAGLKLNRTLTNFLGKFFLYHIYLWQTYLKIIQPYLQTLLWTCILSGSMGMTFLISLASDILSLLTLHIYCFYVYAARLYSLQVYTLLSLARLFTGKKWNILRSRVDSLPYDVDRLFVGTLLFTVLLFLLPTTALFYVVFTALRLLVYVVKYLLSCAIHLVNKMPLFGLLLLVFQPSLLPGGLRIEILENISDQPAKPPDFMQTSPPLPSEVSVLYLKLTNKPLSIAQLRDWSIDGSQETDEEQDSWGAFVGKLLRGWLVYPWIKRN